MKALSFHQPFAWLIQQNLINSDERSWYCSYRGKLAIHASKQNYQEVYDHIKHDLGVDIPAIEKLEHGGFVAIADVVGCTKSNGMFHILFENIQAIPFVPFRGKPGIFDLDDNMVELLNSYI